MVAPDKKQYACVDDVTATAAEEVRLLALAELGLLEPEQVPSFDEATRSAAEFLETPICILGLLGKDRQWIKAEVGLSDLYGLIQPGTLPQVPLSVGLCVQVVDTGKVLAIRDTLAHPVFAKSWFVQHCSIRSYLGVPLLTSGGLCLGTLAVMDLAPRTFSSKQIQFLEMTARWCMSEFERQRLVACLSVRSVATQMSGFSASSEMENANSLKQVKAEMLSHLTQELRTPLTSVLGMTSVLSRGIYGSLTQKQKEYLSIINDSGRYLLSLVDEILAMGELDDSRFDLRLSAVDVEMLCQQVINGLEQDATRREQEIRLTVEPGHRIWLLDKLKVQQLLYHLIFSVIQAATAGSIVRLHVSHKSQGLNILVWVSHPWLGEGVSLTELCTCPLSIPTFFSDSDDSLDNGSRLDAEKLSDLIPNLAFEGSVRTDSGLTLAEYSSGDSVDGGGLKLQGDRSRKCLGLLLSCLLAEIHGGDLSIQGSTVSGYRYQVSLPELNYAD